MFFCFYGKGKKLTVKNPFSSKCTVRVLTGKFFSVTMVDLTLKMMVLCCTVQCQYFDIEYHSIKLLITVTN